MSSRSKRASRASASESNAKSASKPAKKAAKKAKEEEEEEEEDFIVDKIVAHRELRGKPREYLVAWLGYGADHNTWEPRSSFNQTQLVDEYDAQVLRERTVPKKKLRSDQPHGKATRKRGKEKSDAEEEEEEEGEEEEVEEAQGAEDELKKEVIESAGRAQQADRTQMQTSGGNSSRDNAKTAASADANKSSRKKHKSEERPRLVERHVSTAIYKPGSGATLLHVPHDVMRNCILHFLSWKDARACSRVCWALRADALARMRVAAAAQYGDVTSDSTVQMQAMAMLHYYEDNAQGLWHKTRGKMEFCITDRAMNHLVPEVSSRFYTAEQLLRESIKRFRTLDAMVEYRAKLRYNRENAAERKAQYPARLEQLNAALAAANYAPYGE